MTRVHAESSEAGSKRVTDVTHLFPFAGSSSSGSSLPPKGLRWELCYLLERGKSWANPQILETKKNSICLSSRAWTEVSHSVRTNQRIPRSDDNSDWHQLCDSMLTVPGAPVEITSTASMFVELKTSLDFRWSRYIIYFINLIEMAS